MITATSWSHINSKDWWCVWVFCWGVPLVVMFVNSLLNSSLPMIYVILSRLFDSCAWLTISSVLYRILSSLISILLFPSISYLFRCESCLLIIKLPNAFFGKIWGLTKSWYAGLYEFKNSVNELELLFFLLYS